jgi:hypothetical protein
VGGWEEDRSCFGDDADALLRTKELCKMASEQRPRPSLRAFFTNWRESKLPFHRKLALTFRNYWIRLRTRSDCCGHLGEPGC